MTTPSPMTPSARVSQRLRRDAIAVVAKKHSNIDRLEIEDIVGNVSNALAHMLAKDRFRTQWADAMSILLKDVQETIISKGLGEKSAWAKKLAEAAPGYDRVIQQILKQSSISLEAVQLFIEFAEANLNTYTREGYNPAAVVSPQMHALAHMIAEDFDAYEKNLNS